MTKLNKTLFTLFLIALIASLAIAPASAEEGKYDYIFDNPSLTSQQKLDAFTKACGWTPELEAWLEDVQRRQMEAAYPDTNNSTTPSSSQSSIGMGGASADPAQEQAIIDERRALEYAAYQMQFMSNYRATAAYAGAGSGTANDPYLLYSRADIAAMANDLTASYKLMADIDFGGSANPWRTIIGTSSAPFYGQIDGNGHVISNMYVYATSESFPNGLMSYSGPSAIYKRLGFENVELVMSIQTGGSYSFGSVCGNGVGYGTQITEVYVDGFSAYTLTDNNCDLYTGAISGSTSCVVKDCYVSNVDIDTSVITSQVHNNYAGGICALVIDGISAVNCYVNNIYIDIVGSSYAGNTVTAGALGTVRVSGQITANNIVTFNGNLQAIGRPDYIVANYRCIYDAQSPFSIYGGNDLLIRGSPASGNIGSENWNGETITSQQYNSESWWLSSVSYDFDTVWYWDDEDKLPKLRAFMPPTPTISNVQASPNIGGTQTNIQLSATVTNGQSLQWQVSTNGGTTYTNIAGATTNPYTWKPAAKGEYLIRLYVVGLQGDATSSAVSVTIYNLIQITSATVEPTQGGNTETLTLRATTTPDGTPAYQWQTSTNGNTWTNINGATALVHEYQRTGNAGASYFRLAATNEAGTVYSQTLTYTAYNIPQVSDITIQKTIYKTGEQITATTTISGADTIQWAYSKNSGAYQNIQGANTQSLTWQTTEAGAYTLRVTAENVGGTTTKTTQTINIIQTYTPNQISTTSPDISIKLGQTYVMETQYVLPTVAANIIYNERETGIIATGNAFYRITQSTLVDPIYQTTGNTIKHVYNGQNAGIITDINDNTAVYDHTAQTWQYIRTGIDTVGMIATTGKYSAIKNGANLEIYNANGQLIGTTPTNGQTKIVGNEEQNTFLTYGTTNTFYSIAISDGGQIQQTARDATNPITEIKPVYETPNYIIATDQYTRAVEFIAASNTLTFIYQSTDAVDIENVDATKAGVVIGSHGNTAYILAAEGETLGTYQTGANINSASISIDTGLYAAFGGNDLQAYILSKSQSSGWTLSQTITMNAAVSHIVVSATGDYVGIISGSSLYLLQLSDQTESAYNLQGIIVDSSGKPYANKVITINGETFTTDSAGKFFTPVFPGGRYVIVADTTTTEYTATNQALQQIAIKLKVNPLQSDLTYTVVYSSDSNTIDMYYNDANDVTTSVLWEITRTDTNTLVASYNEPVAQYTVPLEDQYTNYYVKLTADKESTYQLYEGNTQNILVTKTWTITPAGGSPINLYGLDENLRNIIFGFILMIIAGLFGVMHKTSGAILTAFAACVMRYLELITIPWLILVIAAALSIFAAIAGGQKE